jgi:hypothetical protein
MLAIEGGSRRRPRRGPRRRLTPRWACSARSATGVLLARGTAQTGASPPLDERTGALEAGLLDPSLAPKIATFRENLDKSLEIAGAISTLTKGKVPVPAPLKLLNRAWKAGCTGRR